VLSVNGDSPLFVTWNLVSSGGGRKLRGCIGTFEALPLAQGLKSYALTAYVYCFAPSECSAFDDSRFDPISKKEIPKLECWFVLLWMSLILVSLC